MKPVEWPVSIDVNPTAKCNLKCTFCWGPDHTIPDELSTQDWQEVMRQFHARGIRNIVFTGGEPLIRKDLPELLRYAKELGMRITLSTNTLLLQKQEAEILPLIDELGIPLDGSTLGTHAEMRPGNPRSFQTVIEALQRVKPAFPHLHVTVRTVVSRVNMHDVEAIGAYLAQHAHLFDRWKVYQFTPISYGEENQDEHSVTDEEFADVAEKLQAFSQDMLVKTFPTKDRTGRYVFVGPEGDVFGVPTDGVTLEVAGNVLESSFADLAPAIIHLINADANSVHGIDAPLVADSAANEQTNASRVY